LAPPKLLTFAPPKLDELPPPPGFRVVVEEQALLAHANRQAILTTLVVLILDSLGVGLVRSPAPALPVM